MIDPEEYRDLVEENAMLRKELKAAKEENAAKGSSTLSGRYLGILV